MSDHTPGPWEIEQDLGADGRVLHVWGVYGQPLPDYPADGGEVIATGLTEANARLIAKAPLLPELVEALRAVALSGDPVCAGSQHGGGSRSYCDCGGEMVRAALAKYDEEPGT